MDLSKIMPQDLTAIIVGALVGALVASWSTYILHKRGETFKLKKENLTQLVSYSFSITEGNKGKYPEEHKKFCEALNACSIVFCKSKPVLKALKIYKSNNGKTEDLMSLYKAICNDLKISYDESFFNNPFIPQM